MLALGYHYMNQYDNKEIKKNIHNRLEDALVEFKTILGCKEVQQNICFVPL